MKRHDRRLARPAHAAARLRANRKPLSWLGLVLLLAAAATIAFPVISPLVLGAAAGWLLWLAGAGMILVSLLAGGRRSIWVSLLASLGAIGAGAFMLLNPVAGAVAAALLIAAVLILDGAFELALALDLRPLQAWRWVLASAIASAVAGVAVVGGAANSRLTLAWALGLALATSGVALISLSRRKGRDYSAARGSVAAVAAARSPSTPST